LFGTIFVLFINWTKNWLGQYVSIINVWKNTGQHAIVLLHHL